MRSLLVQKRTSRGHRKSVVPDPIASLRHRQMLHCEGSVASSERLPTRSGLGQLVVSGKERATQEAFAHNRRDDKMASQSTRGVKMSRLKIGIVTLAGMIGILAVTSV